MVNKILIVDTGVLNIPELILEDIEIITLDSLAIMNDLPPVVDPRDLVKEVVVVPKENPFNRKRPKKPWE